MPDRSDRGWPLPKQPWVMRMTWSELLFAHWPLDPQFVVPHLPDGVGLDTWDGKAWIGVVPFLMSDVAPRLVPALPGLSRFLELNVRTYVSVGGKAGVWFFSLDAASRVAVRVARATFNLPYMDAEMSLDHGDGEMVEYRSRRIHRGEPAAELDVSYGEDGDFFEAQPSSFEHWLTARYCLYSANRSGCIFRGEIDHPPWSLAPAHYTERINTMGQPLRFALTGRPHALIARPIQVRAWLVAKCDRERSKSAP